MRSVSARSRSPLFCLAWMLLGVGCAAEDVSSSSAVSSPSPEQPSEIDQELGGRCRSEADCPQPGAPCRQCADGTFVCPEVDCVKGQCLYSFPQCPPPYDPCAGKSCGETCTLCDPKDPDCVETAVVKYCQGDLGCSPFVPSCKPIDRCATMLCPAGTRCEDGRCVPGVACGSNVCGPDEFCCNASCNICAPTGGRCIQTVCAAG
jgi:hypothetical protein